MNEVLHSTGQVLDPAIRELMEPRFGHDFGNVRVHVGGKAAESALAVNALAYTVGNHLVFGSGQYSPESQQGQKLIAHELTHVVQQSPNINREAISPSEEQTAAAWIFNDRRVADYVNGLIQPPVTSHEFPCDDSR